MHTYLVRTIKSVHVCVGVWVQSSHSADRASTVYECQFCLRSPSHRSGLKIWSLEPSSAIPSSVRQIFLHTQVESSAYLQARLLTSAYFRDDVFHTVNPRRVSPEFYEATQFIASPWHAQSKVRRRRASSPQRSSSNRCCLFR